MYERSKKGDQKKEPSPNSHDRNSISKIKIRNNRRELKIFLEISPNTEKSGKQGAHITRGTNQSGALRSKERPQKY